MNSICLEYDICMQDIPSAQRLQVLCSKMMLTMLKLTFPLQTINGDPQIPSLDMLIDVWFRNHMKVRAQQKKFYPKLFSFLQYNASLSIIPYSNDIQNAPATNVIALYPRLAGEDFRFYAERVSPDILNRFPIHEQPKYIRIKFYLAPETAQPIV